MNALLEGIKAVASPYFSKDAIILIVRFLTPYCENIKAEFYQIIQSKENKPKFELGCILNDTLLDITYTKDSLKRCVLRFESVMSVSIDDAADHTRLDIVSGGMQILFYEAVNEKYRDSLRKYGEFLTNLLIKGDT